MISISDAQRRQQRDHERWLYEMNSPGIMPIRLGHPEIKVEDKPKKKEGKMKEIINDAKNFIKEHKSVFYWLAIVALADHFIFGGAFREKLKGIVNSLIGKLEKQVGDAK